LSNSIPQILQNIQTTGNELETLQGINTQYTIEDRLSTLESSSGGTPVDISGKQDTIIGAATTITSNNLPNNRVLISNNNGKVGVSEVTNTELRYLSGATSNIQTQLITLSEGLNSVLSDDVEEIVNEIEDIKETVKNAQDEVHELDINIQLRNNEYKGEDIGEKYANEIEEYVNTMLHFIRFSN
jgi:hypothetical protein